MSNIFNKICLVWFSLGLALAANKFNAEENLAFSNITKHASSDMDSLYTLDPDNMKLTTSFSWETGFNMSGVSLTNNPKEYLTLYYNNSFYYTLPGETEQSMHIAFGKVQNIEIYATQDKENFIAIERGRPYENFTIHKNASLGVYENVHREVDFSDLSLPSTITYHASIKSEVKVSFPQTKSVKNIYVDDYEYVEPEEISLPTDVVPGLIYLGSDGGQDTTICDNGDCSCSIKETLSVESINLNNNIRASCLKLITTDFSHYQTEYENNLIFYSQVFYLNVTYTVTFSKV